MSYEIKQIFYSLYKLSPKMSLNAKSQLKTRQGALIQVKFTNNEIGYADCFPWEELGDLPLFEQLRLLSINILTPLTQKSIYFAKIDAQHRINNKSVFFNKSFPKNHLITSYDKISFQEINKVKLLGFKYIKLKFGKNLTHEINFIKKYYNYLKDNEIKLRLDFNSILTKDEALNFFIKIENQLDIIDFVEDPIPFNIKNWQDIQNSFPVSLALDRKIVDDINIIDTLKDESIEAFKVIIIKPAIESIQKYIADPPKQRIIPPKQRIIFTSYMDHPLGQLCAMYESQLYYQQFPEKKESCGFLTHQLYESNVYSEQLILDKTTLCVKLDSGFGFTKLLQNQEWISELC